MLTELKELPFIQCPVCKEYSPVDLQIKYFAYKSGMFAFTSLQYVWFCIKCKSNKIYCNDLEYIKILITRYGI